MSRVLLVLAAASLAGCGRTTYEVIERPPRPFHVYGPLELLQVENTVGVADHEGTPFSTVLSGAIEERLAEEEFFARSGEPLKIRCRLTEYASEYSDPKLWGGGGSMTWGRVVLDVEFQGRDGTSAGRVKATGYSKKGGWGIASMNAAQRRAIQALVDFIDDFYDDP